MIDYRWLTPDEIEISVNPVCEQRGWALLNINENPPTALVRGAFEGPSLVAFLVIQLFPMIGPGYADSGHRDGSIFRNLSDQVDDYLKGAGARGALVIAESPVTARLAERHGMARVEDPVYAWTPVGGA